MSVSYFKEFTAYLETHRLGTPVGCTDLEISKLEAKIGNPLPGAYKFYLQLMGRDHKGVMVGTDCFLTDIESNNEYLPELLEENNLSDYALPENYIAFFSHGGYMMAWFAIPNQDDDPQVTYYFEGTTKKPESGVRFTEFMGKDLMGNAKLCLEERDFKENRKKWWMFWK